MLATMHGGACGGRYAGVGQRAGRRYEGGDAEALLDRLARLVLSGVNVIVLLALTDSGRPSYDPLLSAKVAALGIPVFACTPDQFPDLMATALRREDVHSWAADHDIKLIRSDA
ncbi:VWA domain-containing protein [Sphingomonas panacis]|uniref:VWA domain-containing protein n=1 Tax=Sphingomonas panacis TaxID=1560345 RepID=UPI000A7CBECF|nr:VWA domain-containing protein [Sphingomonas panacis]